MNYEHEIQTFKQTSLIKTHLIQRSRKHELKLLNKKRDLLQGSSKRLNESGEF